MRPEQMSLPKDPTLADLLAAVRQDESIWKRRRGGIARSLVGIARLLGHRPTELPADPRLLRRRAESVLLRSACGRSTTPVSEQPSSSSASRNRRCETSGERMHWFGAASWRTPRAPAPVRKSDAPLLPQRQKEAEARSAEPRLRPTASSMSQLNVLAFSRASKRPKRSGIARPSLHVRTDAPADTNRSRAVGQYIVTARSRGTGCGRFCPAARLGARSSVLCSRYYNNEAGSPTRPR